MSTDISCDIIIPVFNKQDLTRNCLNSIEANTRSPYRLIIIDNCSDEATRQYLTAYKSSHNNIDLVLNTENVGWVKAVNQGIAMTSAPFVCVMNNDTVVETNDWLSRLIAVAGIENDIGLVNPDFGDKARCCADKTYIEIDFCRGYCILIKRAAIDKIGGLDEAYGLGYYDDDDYSVRAIRAGFRCVKANDVVVRHLRDSTFTAIFKNDARLALHEKNKQLFYSKWGRRLRIAFMLAKRHDAEKMKGLFLALARRQHIVYVWSASPALQIDHNNIRQKKVVPVFSRLFFMAIRRLNALKKVEKRFDLVFADHDIEGDLGKVISIADKASGQ